MRVDWLYQLTSKKDYPDPVEEIDALCSLDDDDKPTYLLLAKRESPPLSGASCGDIVGLCASNSLGDRLILHATAVVAGKSIRSDTPLSVRPIYNELSQRFFCPLKDLTRLERYEIPDKVLNHAAQEKFLSGQAFVKRLNQRDRSSPKPAVRDSSRTTVDETTFSFPKIRFPDNSATFTVVGLDPTAGTWESHMESGPKKMPSFALSWNGSVFEPMNQPLAWHSTNEEFRAEVLYRKAIETCIDGPCATNGPELLKDRTPWCWDLNAPNEARGGELALSGKGINLFWTTQNTVMRFDGASRWIARSLVLFENRPNQIETHPHGVFTLLWRLFGGTGTPPKKSKPAGRNARLAILRSFIPALCETTVPNHDATDAACAALVAGLHQLKLNIAFGSVNDGGEIWMPNIQILENCMRH